MEIIAGSIASSLTRTTYETFEPYSQTLIKIFKINLLKNLLII